jgi:nascent polypeptide-associated complex subunit beta
VHKAAGGDDKRLQSTLKRLGVTTIQGIEEVAIFTADGVVHFAAPKVQAAVQANTFVVSGPAQTRSLEEMLPSIMRSMQPDALQALAAQLGGAGGGAAAPAAVVDEDDDIPELVESAE